MTCLSTRLHSSCCSSVEGVNRHTTPAMAAAAALRGKLGGDAATEAEVAVSNLALSRRASDLCSTSLAPNPAFGCCLAVCFLNQTAHHTYNETLCAHGERSTPLLWKYERGTNQQTQRLATRAEAFPVSVHRPCDGGACRAPLLQRSLLVF